MKGDPLLLLPDNCFLSPAKVNLFFRVLRKRNDGYHEIATKMQAISLFDLLFIERSAFDTFTCSDSELPTDGGNLVIKARDLFREITGIADPISIHLHKKIPSQAGLGGGSGNAATALYALNSLFGKPLTEDVLMKVSARLGADVPFFFSSGTAFCTGIGQNVENLPFENRECFIIKPKWGISTQGVYAQCLPNACSSQDPLELLAQEVFVNDLEYPVFKMHPELQNFKSKLLLCGLSSLVMTGSGSSFLCYGKIQEGFDEPHEIFPVKHIQRKSQQWYASA